MGKTLNALVKAGLLRSGRGPQGGFSLAVPPDSITLARIIDCFVEQRPHSQCLLGNRPCDGTNPCAAHRLWNEILATRREPLANTTIADLIAGENRRISTAA
jgi:Rrf2 family protein